MRVTPYTGSSNIQVRANGPAKLAMVLTASAGISIFLLPANAVALTGSHTNASFSVTASAAISTDAHKAFDVIRHIIPTAELIGTDCVLDPEEGTYSWLMSVKTGIEQSADLLQVEDSLYNYIANDTALREIFMAIAISFT